MAAAVAAPIAQSSSTAKVDPLAVGYLIGQGLSPSQVTSWTVGACSHRVKAGCMLRTVPGGRSSPTRGAVDPLAVSYLIGQGLSAEPSDVLDRGRLLAPGQGPLLLRDVRAGWRLLHPRSAGSTGFQWGDAGIGAGFALGIVLLLGGAGAGLLISRRNGRQQAARA